MREEKHPPHHASPLLGEWTLDVIQNHKMQRAFGTFLNTRQPDEVRLKAARTILRDGSRHGLILLCEAMHRALQDALSTELTRERIEAIANHPLHAIHGVLRIKALKLLKEPSSHHGRDHLSALRWLTHVCTPEDLELFFELLTHYHEEDDGALHEEFFTVTLYGARTLWLTHADALCESKTWRSLLHAMLFTLTPEKSSLSPLFETLSTSAAPPWYEAALLHGAQINSENLVKQAEFLFALLTQHPARYELLAEQFTAQRDQQAYRWSYTLTTQRIQGELISNQQRARRISHISTCILEHDDPDTLDQLANTLTANRVPDAEGRTIIAHAILPYLCTFTDDLSRRGRLLDMLWNLALDVDFLPLLWHQAHELIDEEHKLQVLRLMSTSLEAQPQQERDLAHQSYWRSRIFAQVMHHLDLTRQSWQGGHHDAADDHHTGFVIMELVSTLFRDESAGELYTSMWTWLLDEALAGPDPAPPYLPEILEVLLEEKLTHHFNTLASPAWQARLQSAHDRMTHHERTMLAMRQALRRLKSLM